jgi:hypothetical protein
MAGSLQVIFDDFKHFTSLSIWEDIALLTLIDPSIAISPM